MSAPVARDILKAVDARLLGWNPLRVDIRWYAAVTGVDCTAAITTAAAEVSEIIFPAGSWVISSTPTVPKGVLITALPGAIFSGAGATALGLPSNTTGFQALQFERVALTGTAFNAGDGLVGPFHYFISNDDVDTTTSASGNLRGLIMNYGVGANHTGGRSAIFGQLQIVGTPSTDPTVGYVAGEFLAQAGANLRGSTGVIQNYKGGVYGINPFSRATSAGTFLAIVNGGEFDVSIAAGGSAARKFGLSIVKVNTDRVQGVYDDAAISIADQDAFALSPPWLYGHSFGAYSAQWAFDGTSTLIVGQQRQFGVPTAVAATAIVAQKGYKIATVGTTNFVAIGAASNTVGVVFIATGAGAGTGTAVPDQSVANIGVDWRNVLFGTYAFASTGFNVNPIGLLTVTPGAANGELIVTTAALTTGAGAGAGTITNAPSAGNPTKWIKINDNGTIRAVPAW